MTVRASEVRPVPSAGRVTVPDPRDDAFRFLARSVAPVGVPNPPMSITSSMIELVGRGGAPTSSWHGDRTSVSLAAVESGFENLHDGEALRSVMVF